MPELPIARIMLRETFTFERPFRIPEPELVMEGEQAQAFHDAFKRDGVLAPVYINHAAHIVSVVRPGDTVYDLGCGPATQMLMAAELCPDSRFVGIDLSTKMLELAEAETARKGLSNASFLQADFTELGAIAGESADAVISTVALHQLPDVVRLRRCFAEVARVLKPGGGLYLVDFGRLKSERSVCDFAFQYEDHQSTLFTADYYNSLKAAFHLAHFKRGRNDFLRRQAKLHSTFLVPFMVALKSAVRNTGSDAQRSGLQALRDAMPTHHQTDLKNLLTFFRLGGLKNPLLT